MKRLSILVLLILLGGLFAGPSRRIPLQLESSTPEGLLNRCVLISDWISKSPEIHFDLPTTRYLLQIRTLCDQLSTDLMTGRSIELTSRIQVINELIEVFNQERVRIVSRKYYPNPVHQYYFWSSARSARSGNS